MNSITQDLTQEVEKLMQTILNFNVAGGISPEWEKVEIAVKEFLIEYAKRQLKELDAAVFSDRPKEWKVEKKDVERELTTEIGKLEFERRYYKNDKTGCYAYLTDLVAGFEKGSKIDIGLGLKLVKNPGDDSYAKSSRLACEGKISKQSVMKLVRRTHDYELDEPKRRPGVKVIHIQADEDHNALQTGHKTITKLITVHEPARKMKKRTWLPQKRHFTGHLDKPIDLWEEVLDYIHEVYDEDVKVYIHGDGAGWIKTGLEIIPGSEFIIDRYHLYEKVDKISKSNFHYKCKIFQYFRHERYDLLKVLLDTIAANDEITEDAAEEAYTYFKNNKAGIRNLLRLPGETVKSCAEGQVSHILSDRLSSRPKAWMPQGLDAVSKIRVFHINGGELKPENLKKKNRTLEIHKKKIEHLRKKYAPNLCCNNVDINKLMPKAGDNRFLKAIAGSLAGL